MNPPERVWRYALEITDCVTLLLPTGSRALSVGPPRNGSADLDLWVLVDPTGTPEPREFRVVGTGNPMPRDARQYIGTTYSHDRALIWHVFEAAPTTPTK